MVGPVAAMVGRAAADLAGPEGLVVAGWAAVDLAGGVDSGAVGPEVGLEGAVEEEDLAEGGSGVAGSEGGVGGWAEAGLEGVGVGLVAAGWAVGGGGCTMAQCLLKGGREWVQL